MTIPLVFDGRARKITIPESLGYMVSATEALPRDDLRTGVPTLFDEFNPTLPRGCNPPHTIDKIKILTHVIYFDEATPADLEAAKEAGITTIRYHDAIKEGEESEKAPVDQVTGDTFYTFSYTSGTTGMPKGVMLTHRNFASNVGGMHKFDGEFEIKDDDVYISYLPLAHVFERCLLLCAMGYAM